MSPTARPKRACQTTSSLPPQSLTVTLEPLRVPVEPRGTRASALDTVGAMSALAQPARLSPGAGKSPALPVLVHGVDDPIDARVVAYPEVGWVDQNDLVIFHGGVLVDPVRVQDAQIGKFAPHLLLGHGLEVALEFNLVDALILGLTEDHTTVVGTLASSATDAASDDDVSLLGLVSETVGLVGSGGSVDARDLGALAVLPGANAE